MWTDLTKMRALTKATNDAKFCAVFSHLSARRLNRLSLPMVCSIRARPLYSSFGKNFGLSTVFSRYGITGQIPRCRAAARFARASYPLSVITARGVMSGPMSSRTSNCRLSLASPPVR